MSDQVPTTSGHDWQGLIYLIVSVLLPVCAEYLRRKLPPEDRHKHHHHHEDEWDDDDPDDGDDEEE